MRKIPPVRTPEAEPKVPGWRKTTRHRLPVAKDRNNGRILCRFTSGPLVLPTLRMPPGDRLEPGANWR